VLGINGLADGSDARQAASGVGNVSMNNVATYPVFT
jgi:hypothetical protein